MIKRLVKKIKNKILKQDNSPLRKSVNGNYIFIHINKTGGTSVAEAIGLPTKRHLQVREVISIIGENEFKEAYVFSVVRNPWSKVVSHYKYRVKTNQSNMADNHISFKDWVKQTYGDNKNPIYYDNPRMFDTQSEWFKDDKGNIRVSNILKFESLNSDFLRVAKFLGIENRLPHLNATKKEPYSKFYDNQTVEIVRKWFKEDIERFNYDYGEMTTDTA